MNISSNLSSFSVEEDSSNHEDSSEERTPKSRVSNSLGSGSLDGTFDHSSSKCWVGWVERGGLTHPVIGLAIFQSSIPLHGESESLGSGLNSLDVELSGSGGRLKVDSFLWSSSSWGSSSSFVSGVSSVEHSSNSGRSSLSDGTVDITSNISSTSDGDSLLTTGGSWGSLELNSNLTDSSSSNSGSTELSLGDTLNSLSSSSTLEGSDGSGVIDLISKWIRLNEKIKLPFSLFGGGSGVGLVGGVKNSSLVGSGVGFGSWGSWSSTWKRWGWFSAVSSISISNSVFWNGHSLGKFTTNIKNNSVIGDIADGLLVGKGHTDGLSTIIFSGNIDSLSGCVEPAFNGLTVKNSLVLHERSRSEFSSGLLTGFLDGLVVPLLVLVVALSSFDELSSSSSDISSFTQNSSLP